MGYTVTLKLVCLVILYTYTSVALGSYVSYHSGGGPLKVFNANELASSGFRQNPCSANLCIQTSDHIKIVG